MENTNIIEKYKEKLPKHDKILEILHFNDVYNIEERISGDVKAGAARFVTALNTYNQKQDKLILFSGDLFFPSFLSDINNGQQMVIPFNKMNVDVSCLGNHELEHGLEVAEGLIA